MKYILLSLFLIFCLPIVAQDFDVDKMNQFFDAIESNRRGMGSLSIYHEGKEVYQRSIGYENVENKLKSSAETRYRIGSITKSFMAVIIMQMIEEDKLNLNSKLSEYYPEFQNSDKITIEHLLRHRSGLFNFTNDPSYLDYMEIAQSQESLLKKMITNDNTFEPGEKMEYSNTGYVLLSFIAEKLDQKSFDKILADRITTPQNLKDTYYGGKIGSQANEAQSYTAGRQWSLATETDMSIPVGAGAIVSTPSDINNFYHALFSGKIIKSASLDKMTEMVDGYGYGLFEFPFGTRKALGHNGGIDGFSSSAGHFMNDDMTICYISNGTDWAVNNILIGALSIYFGLDYEIPSLKLISVSDKLLDKYEGVYSSPTFPLKITITKSGGSLSAQATGQGAFPLEALGDHKFKFDAAGINMIFDTQAETMTFTQGPGKYELKKE